MSRQVGRTRKNRIFEQQQKDRATAIALQIIERGQADDAEISRATGLPIASVAALRKLGRP